MHSPLGAARTTTLPTSENLIPGFWTGNTPNSVYRNLVQMCNFVGPARWNDKMPLPWRIKDAFQRWRCSLRVHVAGVSGASNRSRHSCRSAGSMNCKPCGGLMRPIALPDRFSHSGVPAFACLMCAEVIDEVVTGNRRMMQSSSESGVHRPRARPRNIRNNAAAMSLRQLEG